jgi:hypothetical protein
VGGLAVGQADFVPGAVAGVKRAADVDRIDAETIENEILRLGELLDDIVDPRMALEKAEVTLEVAVRDRRDAGGWRGAEIDRHAVRLAMVDGGKDTFAGGHAEECETGKTTEEETAKRGRLETGVTGGNRVPWCRPRFS